MANVSKETLDRLKTEGYSVCIYDQYMNNVNIDDPTAYELRISNWDIQMLGEIVKLPKKKEVTYDRIMTTINSKSEYMSIVKDVKKLIDTKKLRCYPTTYGLGVETIFGSDSDNIKSIEDILTGLGVKFRTESSEAGWVYRFVISKKQSNLNKIK